MTPNQEREIARCIAEQRVMMQYEGPDKRGARQGLDDLVAEECLLRLAAREDRE